MQNIKNCDSLAACRYCIRIPSPFELRKQLLFFKRRKAQRQTRAHPSKPNHPPRPASLPSNLSLIVHAIPTVNFLIFWQLGWKIEINHWNIKYFVLTVKLTVDWQFSDYCLNRVLTFPPTPTWIKFPCFPCILRFHSLYRSYGDDTKKR